LGVTPTAPGFARVTIQPHICGLMHAAGSVCTPHGSIEVAWQIHAGQFTLKIHAPAGLDVTVIAPDSAATTRRFSGGAFQETFSLSARV
jgi:hypothetical protein